ncbi:MAG: formimidoylglutamate deiminase, partial [Proteobacteria bacterium]
DDCMAWSGQRPVTWLLDHVDVDKRWCLVHATHMTPSETARLASSGAVAGLCPTTEANLGDGLFDAVRFLEAGGVFGVGSDSQISISPIEELRWLEYGMRLRTRSRNVLAGEPTRHTGQRLLEGALSGGARACGRPIGAIAVGRRADFVVLADDHPRLYGRRGESLADSLVFSGNESVVREVYVGGRRVISQGRHPMEERIALDFRRALDALNR